jgi:cell wall-associated NlpC family hydrolase
MKVSLLAVALAALFFAPAALAGRTYARVVGPSGRVLAVGSSSAFDYPSDGSLVHIGSAMTSASGAALTDIQLLAGMVDVSEVDVFSNGQDSLGTVAAAGRVVTPVPNELIPLGNLGYLIVEQTAVSGRDVGRVALRLVIQSATTGAQPGTEILIGTPVSRTASAPAGGRAGAGSFDPLAVLGLSADAPGAADFVPPPALGRGSIGEQAVAIAEQYLGVPYVWGGASPLTGFDCSGLALYVYAQLGIKLTHYTGAQYFEGLQIPLAQLAPGDLLFFDQTATLGPQHEGIYIGDGRFIQAPHTGDVVKISSLSDPAYGFSFVGAVRPYVGKP